MIDAHYLRRMYSAYRWFPAGSSLFNDSLELATIVPDDPQPDEPGGQN